MHRCPNCQSRDIGKIGSHQYYCWNCFIELSVNSSKKVQVYEVQEDGSLSAFQPQQLSGVQTSKLQITN